ncbi:hypothetical protein [Microbacterium sp. EST19A]|uniref:hypothetical protein n=1 Tax=Microbacterium sp. EST19A TaxID=2862681 RepID=UPI001CBA7FA0|nr:hypothetical protein [Microbacterium sp. EST19A]
MGSNKVRVRLHEATATTSVVRVQRRPKHADRLDGIVLRVGKRWALMARTVDGGYLDGLVAFRVKDVKRISDDESLASAFAKTLPEWPPSYSDPLDLDSTVGLLNGFGQGGRLIGIQKEKERDALWIGILDQILGRFVYLHEVRHDAVWNPEPLGYRLRSITAVEIGRRYFSALTAIAGESPEHPDATIHVVRR